MTWVMPADTLVPWSTLFEVKGDDHVQRSVAVGVGAHGSRRTCKCCKRNEERGEANEACGAPCVW